MKFKPGNVIEIQYMEYKIGNVIFHTHSEVLKIGYISDIIDGISLIF